MFGRRDREDADAHGSQRVEDSSIELIDLEAVRAERADAAADRAITHLSSPVLQGFWIHFDADVLDDAIMPAVDYRMPEGLSWDELATVLNASIGSRRAIGIDVTIFNPKLDKNGSIALALAETLARGLRP